MTPKQPVTSPSVVPAPAKNIYLTNKQLLAEIKRAKKKGEMTNELARMLQMLCAKYAKKGSFVNYTYNEDMQAYAMMMLVRTWNSFDPEKSNNPFAFFTQCIKNSFIQYLNQEKRQRNIRDLLLVDQGLNPSYGFGDGTKKPEGASDDEEDFDVQKLAAAELNKLISIDTEGVNPADIGPVTVVNTDEETYTQPLLK